MEENWKLLSYAFSRLMQLIFKQSTPDDEEHSKRKQSNEETQTMQCEEDIITQQSNVQPSSKSRTSIHYEMTSNSGPGNLEFKPTIIPKIGSDYYPVVPLSPSISTAYPSLTSFRSSVRTNSMPKISSQLNVILQSATETVAEIDKVIIKAKKLEETTSFKTASASTTKKEKSIFNIPQHLPSQNIKTSRSKSPKGSVHTSSSLVIKKSFTMKKGPSPSVQNLIQNNARNLKLAQEKFRALTPKVNQKSCMDIVWLSDGQCYPRNFFGPNETIPLRYTLDNYDNSDILSEILSTLNIVLKMVKAGNPSHDECMAIHNHLKRLASIYVHRKQELRRDFSWTSGLDRMR